MNENDARARQVLYLDEFFEVKTSSWADALMFDAKVTYSLF